MGPKKGKGGKGKLSKAEKERIKKEEAEQRAREEEEARIQAELEEREREEREQREREERRIFEEQERARHQAEIDELNEQLAKNSNFLNVLHQKEIEKKKWDRYMLCDGRPDPSSKKDVNTFINLTKEDHTNIEMKETLANCEMILELLDELKDHLNEAKLALKSDENEENILNNEKLIDSYKESTMDLQNLIFTKLDESAFDVLHTPEHAIDPDTLNISQVEESPRFKLCLWGNASKNPRVKQVEFPNDGFTMELPKQMVLTNIATRSLYIGYDFLSSRCSTYAYKPPKPIVIPDIVEEVDETSEKANDGEERATPFVTPLTTPQLQLPSKSTLAITDKKSNNKSASKNNLKGSTYTLSPNKGSKHPSSSRLSAKASKKKASTAALSTVEIQPEPPTDQQEEEKEKVIRIDDEDYVEEDVIDLRSFSPIGPLIMVELLELPHQAKEMNGWTIQQVSNNSLQRIPYGVKTQQPSVSSINQSTVSIHSRKSDALGYNLPIAFSFSIDDKILLHEAPQLARWDEESQHWKTSEITDIRYESEDKLMFFRTLHFGTFALMQDIYLNMPFQTWTIRPIAMNECIFTIVGAFIEVDIVVKESLCSVKFPEVKPQVEHIVGKWVKPQELFKMLRAVGINLFPYRDGDKYVSICKKEESFVDTLYQHMAVSASCCSYTWSKWNSDIGQEKVVVQACEWNSPKIPSEESYQLYLASERICCKLKMTEYDREFSEEIFPQTQMHPGLYHMIRDGGSDEMMRKLKETSVVFINCVHQLLSATNVFMYS